MSSTAAVESPAASVVPQKLRVAGWRLRFHKESQKFGAENEPLRLVTPLCDKQSEAIDEARAMQEVFDQTSGSSDTAGDTTIVESSAEAIAVQLDEPEQLALAFDYSSLNAETRSVVETCTREIKERLVSMRNSAVEVGERLLVVKDELGHGRFGDWLKAEFDWSPSSAEKWMNQARLLVTDPRFKELKGQFGQTALSLLAAPSTPNAARDEAVARAELGDHVTHQTAQEIITRLRAENEESSAPAIATVEAEEPPSHSTVIEEAPVSRPSTGVKKSDVNVQDKTAPATRAAAPSTGADPEGWSSQTLTLSIHWRPGRNAQRLIMIGGRVGPTGSPTIRNVPASDLEPLPPAIHALIGDLKASYAKTAAKVATARKDVKAAKANTATKKDSTPKGKRKTARSK